ncbi:glycosyltransferase family 2 protein [Patescibacteria group bacterium]|nr:glycosyltransferase family 2 protein [Patescibacteria group bacterium]
MKLSVVTTLYQSAPYIEEFVRRVSVEAKKITDDYEIVMVDDGSPDNSLITSLNIQKSDPHLHIIELSRNFGHHKAMMTGLEYARGELVFLIDVDLEEPPELLTHFHDERKKGDWDVIYGVQKERKGGLIKKVGGRFGWWLIQLLVPVEIPYNLSTVRLMRSAYVGQLIRHKEHMTAIGGLWVLTGFRQHGLLFDKTSRGESTYSFVKRLKSLLDSVTSFSQVPLYGVFFLGLVIFFASSLVTIALIIRRLTGYVLEGWISVMVSVWGLGGLILLCIGLVGLYISRIFIETKKRPYVIVRNDFGTHDRISRE